MAAIAGSFSFFSTKVWPLAALSRWLPYRGKIYSKMHWGDLRVAAMDRWPPYGGGREGRFDCIYIFG